MLVGAVHVVGKMSSDGLSDLPFFEARNDLFVYFYMDLAAVPVFGDLGAHVLPLTAGVLQNCRFFFFQNFRGSAQAPRGPALRKNLACSRWSRF